MVEEVLNVVKERIAEAEARMKELETLINVMKKAGEDVSELEIRKNELKTRIERWKKALGM